jgi:hypothetical protein
MEKEKRGSLTEAASAEKESQQIEARRQRFKKLKNFFPSVDRVFLEEDFINFDKAESYKPTFHDSEYMVACPLLDVTAPVFQKHIYKKGFRFANLTELAYYIKAGKMDPGELIYALGTGKRKRGASLGAIGTVVPVWDPERKRLTVRRIHTEAYGNKDMAVSFLVVPDVGTDDMILDTFKGEGRVIKSIVHELREEQNERRKHRGIVRERVVSQGDEKKDRRHLPGQKLELEEERIVFADQLVDPRYERKLLGTTSAAYYEWFILPEGIAASSDRCIFLVNSSKRLMMIAHLQGEFGTKKRDKLFVWHSDSRGYTVKVENKIILNGREVLYEGSVKDNQWFASRQGVYTWDEKGLYLNKQIIFEGKIERAFAHPLGYMVQKGGRLLLNGGETLSEGADEYKSHPQGFLAKRGKRILLNDTKVLYEDTEQAPMEGYEGYKEGVVIKKSKGQFTGLWFYYTGEKGE